MLSAHGSSPEVVKGAGERAGVVIDAVCPLVTKVHHEVKRMAEQDFDIIYVGHEGHDEATGTVAVAPGAISLVQPEIGLAGFDPADSTKVALLAQTTLGLHEWQAVLERSRATISRPVDGQEERSLLRNHQPPGGCPATRRSCRLDSRRRLGELVEHPSAGSSGRGSGDRRIPDRQCRGYSVRVADRHPDRRTDGRGVGSRPSGSGGHRPDRSVRRFRTLPCDRRRGVLPAPPPAARLSHGAPGRRRGWVHRQKTRSTGTPRKRP